MGPTKMTWKHFKEVIEKHGIMDDDNISFIDVVGLAYPTYPMSDAKEIILNKLDDLFPQSEEE